MEPHLVLVFVITDGGLHDHTDATWSWYPGVAPFSQALPDLANRLPVEQVQRRKPPLWRKRVSFSLQRDAARAPEVEMVKDSRQRTSDVAPQR